MRKTTRKSLASQTRPSRTNKRKRLNPQKLINTTKKATGKVIGTTKIPVAMTISKEAITTRDENVTKEDKDVKGVIMKGTVKIGTTNTQITNSLETVKSNLTIVEVVDKAAEEQTETKFSATSRETFMMCVKSTTQA